MNYILYGSEAYIKQEQVNKIIKEHHVNEFDVQRLDGTKTSLLSILEDAQTIPFFTDFKVLIIEQCAYFQANNGLREEEEEALLRYLNQPLQTSIVIFSCPFEKLDSRKKVTKQALQLCRSIVCNQLDEREMKLRMDQMMKKLSYSIPSAIKQQIYLRVGNDLTLMNKLFEILRLQTEMMSLSELDVILPRRLEDNVFELLSTIMKKNKVHMFSLLQDFDANNIEVIQLIGILASQLRFQFQVSHLYRRGLNEAEIAKELSVHPYRVKLAIGNRTLISNAKIMKYLHLLSELDQGIKSGKIDKRLGLELFCIETLK